MVHLVFFGFQKLINQEFKTQSSKNQFILLN